MKVFKELVNKVFCLLVSLSNIFSKLIVMNIVAIVPRLLLFLFCLTSKFTIFSIVSFAPLFITKNAVSFVNVLHDGRNLNIWVSVWMPFQRQCPISRLNLLI